MFSLDLEINRALLTSASAVSEGAVGGTQGGEKKRQVQTIPSRNFTGKETRRNNSRKGLGVETGVLFYFKRLEHV